MIVGSALTFLYAIEQPFIPRLLCILFGCAILAFSLAMLLNCEPVAPRWLKSLLRFTDWIPW